MSLPPLVEPAAELTVDEVRRYSRHLIIPDVGMDGQKRLKNAKVLCVGAGGLGSPALMYLAAAGVGTLGIVEFDEVDESNLQRQIIHSQSDIGRSKAQSARDSVKGINPYVDVVLHEVFDIVQESGQVKLNRFASPAVEGVQTGKAAAVFVKRSAEGVPSPAEAALGFALREAKGFQGLGHVAASRGSGLERASRLLDERAHLRGQAHRGPPAKGQEAL